MGVNLLSIYLERQTQLYAQALTATQEGRGNTADWLRDAERLLARGTARVGHGHVEVLGRTPGGQPVRGRLARTRGRHRPLVDLRRAGATLASTVIVLNYRSDKDASAADTEVLSTVMAAKNVNPTASFHQLVTRPPTGAAYRGLSPG
jgi:hypothetical protein